MKTVLTLCAGLAVGGLGFWAIHAVMQGEGDAPGSEEQPPPAVGGPRLAGGASAATAPTEPLAAAPGASAAGTRAAGTAVVGGPPVATAPGVPPSTELAEGNSVARGLEPRALFSDEPVPEPRQPFDRSSEVGGLRPDPSERVMGGELTRQRRLACATFDAGETSYGKQLLETVYGVWKDRETVDLVPEVSRLLRVEDAFARRREYLAYVSHRSDAETVFEEQHARAVAKLENARKDSGSALAAWAELSLAYDAAPTPAHRKLVLAKLEPFLDHAVFSGRSTLILETYTVQGGDNLTLIAKRNDTTVGAIRRLNRLDSDVIRPRQRLRVLPGKIRTYVRKSEFRLWVTVDDRFLFERQVGLGKEGGTPEGEFVVRVKERDPAWWQPGRDPIPPGDPRNVLGSRWLGFAGTEDHSGYGIHGTSDPLSIGKESSAGCVRMLNKDVELLYDFLPSRGAVVILP